jgi:hypothetical protein
MRIVISTVLTSAFLCMNLAGAPRVDNEGDPLPDAAIARFGSARLRHPAAVEALSYSPDGKFIASSCPGHRHKSIRLWNAATGQLVRELGEGRHGAVCLAFSPNSRILAGGEGGRAVLWDVESGKEIANLDTMTEAERTELERCILATNCAECARC